MDKLKPILVHKFWIILFIALLLPMIGWSMATGSLAKEIDERKTAIDKAFTDAQVPPNPPNETWSSALKQINQEKDNYIGQSRKYLWEKQKSLFVWPPDITPLMKETPYRGEISRVPRNLYRSAYEFELLRAHKLANPFSLRDGTGTVDINENVLPHVPLDKWKTLPPSSQEMWDAQEDVWLVSSILEAIARVNKGASNISESAVRQISVLQLRGGTVGDTGGNAGGGEGMEGGMEEGMMGGGGGFGSGGGGRAGMRNGQDGMQNIDVDIDLKEIFGNDADASAGGADGSGDMGAEDSGMLGGGLGGSGFSGGGATQNLKRYYDEAEELPYKTRAFYIKAVIQSSKLPHLMAELTNMPWPAEIVRVQRADMFDDHLNPIATVGGMAGGRGNRGGSGFNSTRELGGAGFGRSGIGAGFEADGATGSGRSQLGLENKGLLDAALMDPELAVVSIAGLMTLYKPYTPPEGEIVAQTEEATGSNPEQAVPDTAAQPSDAAAATPDSAAASGESPANPDQPKTAADPPLKNEPAPTGDSPKAPAESAEPKQPADSKPDESQPPKTEPKSAEAVNK